MEEAGPTGRNAFEYRKETGRNRATLADAQRELTGWWADVCHWVHSAEVVAGPAPTSSLPGELKSACAAHDKLSYAATTTHEFATNVKQALTRTGGAQQLRRAVVGLTKETCKRKMGAIKSAAAHAIRFMSRYPPAATPTRAPA